MKLLVALALFCTFSSTYTFDLGNEEGGERILALRQRRSLQPGAPNFPLPSSNTNWKVDPSVAKDRRGNTVASLGVGHTGANHEVHGTWTKIVDGPSKSKPTYNIGGSYRFRRFAPGGWSNGGGGGHAPQIPSSNGGWKVGGDLNRGSNGNSRASVGIEHKGPNHKVGADVSQVIHGPNRESRPNIHVGGSYKW